MTLRELHLFAGAGGGLLGSLLLGHRPVCAVEIDPYCRRVLAARRDEGWLPAEMEIHDDVTTFNGHAWRGRVDLVAGGFPCQDISVAGKGAGLEGARSGLFYELLRVVREVGPRWVFLENVPAITSRGLDRVLGALAELGFDAEWCVLSAADAGAPHLRKRWWCLARLADATRRQGDGQGRGDVACEATARRCGDAAALAGGADDPDAEGRGLAELRSTLREAGHADGVDAHPDADGGRQQVERQPQHDDEPSASWRQPDGLRSGGRRRGTAADAEGARLEARDGRRAAPGSRPERAGKADADAGPAERRLGGVADGLAEWLDQTAAGYWAGDWETEPRLAQGQPNRVARLRALGNGQVPQTAAMAFRILMQRYEDNP